MAGTENVATENKGVRREMTDNQINDVYAAQVKQRERAAAWSRLIEQSFDVADVEFGELLLGSFSCYGLFYSPGGRVAGIVNMYVREDVALFIRVMKKLGAKITKEWPKDESEYATVRVIADFTGHPQYGVLGEVTALPYRGDICERVEIGEREVEVVARDEKAVEEAIKEIPEIVTTKMIKQYEWQCHSLLGE